MPAAKTASTARRTRKSTSLKSKVVSKESVTKYTQPRETMTVTEETPKTRPPLPTLTLKDYREDFRARMAIHNYEIAELWTDTKNAYQIVKEHSDKLVKYIKDMYTKEFVKDS